MAEGTSTAVRTFPDALKAFRRGVYKYPSCWRAVVVCVTPEARIDFFNEAWRTLGASSLKVETVNHAEMKISTERGGEVIFRTVADLLDGRIRGYSLPHVIITCPVTEELKDRLRVQNRSPFVDDDKTRWDEVIA